MTDRLSIFMAMLNRTHVIVAVPNETRPRHAKCLINSMEMEDGSGFCFNLRVSEIGVNNSFTVFINTRQEQKKQHLMLSSK